MRLRLVERTQLFLDAQRQPRQHRVDEHALVRGTGGAVEFCALVETEAERPWHVLAAVRGGGKLARGFQRPEDWRQVRGGAVGRFLHELAHGVDACADGFDVAAVFAPAQHPGANDHRCQQGDQGVAADDERAAAAFPAAAGAGHAVLGEDDLGQQALQEVAAPAALLRRQHGLFQLVAACHRTEHAVDRRALLGAADEIDAAQQRVGLERRGREDLLDEFLQGRAQARELPRKTVDALAALRIGFGLQAIDEPGVQALQQGVELRSEFLLPRCGDFEREREAPGRRALFLVERGVGVAEARHQVALGDQQVDRQADAELLVQFLQALAHRLRRGAPDRPNPCRSGRTGTRSRARRSGAGAGATFAAVPGSRSRCCGRWPGRCPGW